MQNLVDSLIAFQNLMRQARIPVMAIGGIAVAVWGEPRLTRDIEFEEALSDSTLVRDFKELLGR